MQSAITRAAAKHSVAIACAKLLERWGMVEEGLGLGANNDASDRATRCRRIRLRLYVSQWQSVERVKASEK